MSYHNCENGTEGLRISKAYYLKMKKKGVCENCVSSWACEAVQTDGDVEAFLKMKEKS